MEVWNEYSAVDVAIHRTEADCWLIIGGDGAKKVYDVSGFLEDHPGGPDLLLDHAGQDVQDEFQDIGHSREARDMLEELCIGVLREEPLARMHREALNRERISLLRHPETTHANVVCTRSPLTWHWIGLLIPFMAVVVASFLSRFEPT